ncbi:hypothetical protein Q3G72_030670 [Acer saccharum]|nr:hypothetical protein Q3G72_030670 [Acer saccharum]
MALNVDKFAEYVKKAIGMEFNLSSSTFVHGLQALSQISKTTWEHKIKVYRSLGWSDDEFWLAFKKHPICIKSSEKKITSVVDFLVNKMGWKPSDVARTPSVLCYIMEKRIVPRCSVIRILLLKGLVKKEFAISSVLLSTEKYFLDTFMIKYQDQVPYLLSVFQGKMGLLELGLEFDQKSITKVV